DIIVDSTGNVTVAGAVAATAGNVLLQAGGDIAIAESVAAPGEVTLTAGGSIIETGDGRIENAALLSTQSSGGQTLTAANTVRGFLATNTGGGNIELVNTADLAIAGISQEAGDIIVDNTGNVTVAGSVVTAGGDILMQVAQDITIADSITTASNVSLTAGGSIMQTGEGRIKNAALLSTQSSSGQALTGANTVKAIDAVNTGTGDIEFANAEALTVARVVQNAGDVIIISTGDLDVAGPISIAVSGSVELRAVGNLTVDASTEAGDGGDITLEASGDESDAILNASLAGNGDISMTAGRDISIGERIGTVGAVELVAGGQIFETGSGRIEAAELVASSGSGQTLLSANTIRSFTSVNTGAGDIVLNNTAGVLDLESISQAGGGVVVFNDGDLRVHRIMAPAGKVRLRATGSILAATGSAFRVDDGGATNVQAMDIELTAVAGSIGDSASRLFVTASGDTTAWAARDVRLGVRNGNLSSQSIISEAGSIDLVVGDGSVGIKDLRAAGSIDIEALHSALIEQVTAVSLDLALTGIGSSLSVVRASVREYVEASADSIVFLELAHTGTEPLGLSITGGSRSMADTVAVYATSDAGIAFDRLVADLSFIDARVDDLLFRQVIVGRQAEMRNRYRKVIADNVAQKLFACDVQLYPGSDPFYLFMIADGKTMTDALVFNYSQDYIAEGYAGSGNTLVETAEAILEAAGHQPTWVVDYYEQAVMTSLSAGRTNVILYIPSSPSIGITESDADETEETDEGGDTTHE
ncbi:MAG: hypothetical protein GXX08_04490, partial [Firmicutes bacterium]|nr:hypothetical protein [Bacillota bacterium]